MNMKTSSRRRSRDSMALSSSSSSWRGKAVFINGLVVSLTLRTSNAFCPAFNSAVFRARDTISSGISSSCSSRLSVSDGSSRSIYGNRVGCYSSSSLSMVHTLGRHAVEFPFMTRVREGHALSQKTSANHLAHDEIVFRDREGEVVSIPQAERYSSRDWLHNLRTLPTSVILGKIKGPIIWLSVWSMLVTIAQAYYKFQSLSIKPATLLGSALGLLLVMRTNSGVSRFWEGRKCWEQILNQSRDMARMCDIYKDVIGMKRVRKISNLTCAFAVALIQHLKGFRSTQYFEQLMSPSEIEDLFATRSNKPLKIVNRMAEEVRKIQYCEDWTSRERLAMLSIVNKLSSCMGACERLVQTPVPLHYVRHTSRFLTVWCAMLPLVMVSDLGILTVPMVAISSWALFGIQEIGLFIENPFESVLKMEIICNTIYSDVMETIGDHEAASGAGPVPMIMNGYAASTASKHGLIRDDDVTQVDMKAEAEAAASGNNEEGIVAVDSGSDSTTITSSSSNNTVPPTMVPVPPTGIRERERERDREEMLVPV